MTRRRVLFLWLAWHVFGLRSVLLFDRDGDINARSVIEFGGRMFANRFRFGIRTVELDPDGSVIGASYVTRWEPLFPNPWPTPR